MATGDETVGCSFDDAFDACYLAAYRAAFRVLADRSSAEDIAQEAMTRAYVRWNKVRRYPEPWAVRVAINLSLDLLRQQRQPAVVELRASNPVDETVADRLDLLAALARLPRRQREVVALRYIADLSEEDVMSVLGCSGGTVKKHAHRGIAALRAARELKTVIA